MFANQYEEHLASQPDNSCWDGFDRGTVWAGERDEVVLVIGRMTNKRGQRVLIEQICLDEGDFLFRVSVNGMTVFCEPDNRDEAIDVARSWMGMA